MVAPRKAIRKRVSPAPTFVRVLFVLALLSTLVSASGDYVNQPLVPPQVPLTDSPAFSQTHEFVSRRDIYLSARLPHAWTDNLTTRHFVIFSIVERPSIPLFTGSSTSSGTPSCWLSRTLGLGPMIILLSS